MIFNKITLGTVQFGLDYGATNQRGKIPFEEVAEILRIAKKSSLLSLDTASAYGTSEQVLGDIGVSGFNIYSKISKLTFETNEVDIIIGKEIEKTLKRLNVEFLEGIYLHDPKILNTQFGSRVYKSLEKFKQEGYFNKIGLSIYKPEEYQDLSNKFPMDMIQFPVSLFDQRFVSDPLLSIWSNQGVELNVRSIFLQGILLQPLHILNGYFHKWSKLFYKRDAWVEKEGITFLAACLYPILSHTLLNHIVIGVDSLLNLRQILDSISNFKHMLLPSELSTNDPDLIFPYNWKQI